ncbi:hypothetical protein EVAR_28837_1 [Eumeta japonica]|uniref:Uncharacterized protein n=1 Tax=Eumeta variegata TaxID=151549 RepID=A0A4C1WKK6_EUMVA|nr:hypothetical protein EVAR_28837_1 [Eumeta japonica]
MRARRPPAAAGFVFARCGVKLEKKCTRPARSYVSSSKADSVSLLMRRRWRWMDGGRQERMVSCPPLLPPGYAHGFFDVKQLLARLGSKTDLNAVTDDSCRHALRGVVRYAAALILLCLQRARRRSTYKRCKPSWEGIKCPISACAFNAGRDHGPIAALHINKAMCSAHLSTPSAPGTMSYHPHEVVPREKNKTI